MQKLRSKKNPRIKYLNSLLKKKYRYEEKLFFIEGYVVNSEVKNLPEICVVDEIRLEEYSPLLKKYESAGVEIISVNSEIISYLSDTVAPQGIICYYRFIHKSEKTLDGGKYLYLDDVRDPGNLGTIIRTADAFSIDGIILSEDTVDLYNPKAVRASMASVLRIPIYIFNLEELTNIEEFRVVSAYLGNSIDIREYTFSDNSIVAVGNEAHGISDEILKLSQDRIVIPIGERVDSLNVAIATGIVLYEMTNA